MPGRDVPSFEDARRFIAELARRRVFQVVAIYGGAAFAVLQGADIVIDGLGLPPRVLTALTILVLAGFVVALVVGWLYDLDAAGRLRRTDPAPAPGAASVGETPGSESTALGWPLRVAGVLALVVGLGASWMLANRISPPEPAYAVSDPRGSFLVAPIDSRGQSTDEVSLANRAAGRLMFKLRGWESVRVVQELALSGMLYDLEVPADRAPSLDQAFQMARTQRVGTLIGLRLASDADAVRLEATLYDVASRREVAAPGFVTGSAVDLDGLVAPVAHAVLRLRDQDVDLESLRSESPDPEAHQEFTEGLAALWDWRLTVAEQHFEEAIAEDSMFAAAYHYLALSLYWQTARYDELIVSNGPEIARLTQTARRLAATRELRPGLRDHVEALGAFWAGDYEGARNRIASLLARDSSDTEAWLLRGAVEVADPYLEQASGIAPRPRRNPNVARRAFERAIRLSPDLQLSYGHLFALDRELLDAVVRGEGCPAFEQPDAAGLPPYMAPEAGRQTAFCPVVADSVIWIPADSLATLELATLQTRARGEMRRTRAVLENWARIHPDQPRPHEELDRWLSWRRSLSSCGGDATELAELAEEIGAHRERALSLRRDTTLEDRSRLALLRLAEERPEAALELLAAAGLPSESAFPPAAASVYLAVGMTDRAIEAAAAAYAEASWGRADPADGSILFAGDVADEVREIVMRGTTGDAGPALEAAFRRLLDAWSAPEYSSRQSVLLREMMLQFGLEPGLVIEPDIRRAWFDGWRAQNVAPPVLWRGGAGDAGEPPRDGSPAAPATATSLFVDGALAWERNDVDRAVDRLSRLESCPLSLDGLDAGWGLRTVARYYVARALEARGDSVAADAAMERFRRLWRGRSEGPFIPTRR